MKSITETPVSVSLSDIVITPRLVKRPVRRRIDSSRETAALHELSNALMHGSASVLKQLAKIAIDLCQAGSAGISLIEAGESEDQIFRWRALAGRFEPYEGGTTPREWSPCGHCLGVGKPILYSYPGRYFTYFQEVDITIVEGLVIPLYVNRLPIGTIWIISHDRECRFDAEHVRVMTSLGSFAAGALRPELLGTPARSADEDYQSGRRRVDRAIIWEEYLRRIARSDEVAFAALFDETQPLIFSIALRILSFRADAEEVVDEVFTQVWKTAASFDRQRGSAAVWLATLSRSRAVDYFRRRATRFRMEESLEKALLVTCASTADPEARAASSQVKRYLLQALQTLPLAQRQALQLAYFSGLSMPEIAHRLGHPLGSVKTRIRSGLSKLRLLLAAVA